jgi:hypothetical protein
LENEKEVLAYDTVKNEWSRPFVNRYPPDFWQHNRFISGRDSSLYLLGGYGHHRYKNDLRIYHFGTGAWTKTPLKGDPLPPHYLSGLGKLDSAHVLVFGGYGSESGSQELSPRFYYDLYKIHTETLQSQKLWSLEPAPEDHFVVSNSIVADTLTRSFYALAFPTQLFYSRFSLLKFSIDRPVYEPLGDEITIHFEDTKSYIDLYLDQVSNRLIAVASYPNTVNDTASIVSFYSLSYPPLSKDDLYQEEKSKGNASFLLAGIILLLLSAGASAWYYYGRRTRTTPGTSSAHVSGPKAGDVAGAALPPPSPAGGREIKKSAIYLFGGFLVTDKAGNDITKEFTPMLKHLFVLLLLYTHKGRKGISSVKLKDTLWFDKSEESAKNNRGVSISKLRQIFEQTGQVDIISYHSYWRVALGGDVYCDYTQALSLMEKLSGGKEWSPEDLSRLLRTVSTGNLLPNLQTEWIDSFKADFSSTLVDLLLNVSRYPDVAANPQLCIDLADAVFIHDSLNEDALRLKCKTLVRMGRNGLARNTYAFFAREYSLLFGASFSHTFDQVIHAAG